MPKLLISKYFVSAFLFLSALGWAALPPWSYDPGPDTSTKMGKELVDLVADMPYMPGISEEFMKSQKFRPVFGPTIWRMRLAPDSVKILFIGQDATHIAEAAGRTATAGFGGRAQNLAKYFGVNESAAFINTYAFTIQGQYGAFESPYIEDSKLRFGGFVDNPLWLMTQDLLSPIARWRNRLIDWIIRNNQGSLRLIVSFGGAARDAMGSFIESKGGTVETRLSEDQLENIRIPETMLAYAGGNNEFPVAVNHNGEDLYAALVERKLKYSDLDDIAAAKDALTDNLESAIEEMVFSDGGEKQSGMIHGAQLGGYNLQTETKDGTREALTLKDLVLSDGKEIESHLLVVQLPHPSALSRLDKKKASESVSNSVKSLRPFLKRYWSIEPDPGMVSDFENEKEYEYSRTDIGPEYYDFGAPGIRMVPVSTASRMPKNPHIIIFGTREKAEFDAELLEAMTNAKIAEEISEEEIFTMHPRGKKSRFVFDPGPGEMIARLMKVNLDFKKIYATKPGKTWDEDGIAAFNVKSHPEVGDFGHYRGTFTRPRIIVLADPAGYDDIISSRALTGERGQYLHGVMRDLEIGGQYLVIKTVPFGMDGATNAEWKTVLKLTQMYRDEVIAEALKSKSIEAIVTDGPFAKLEAKRMSQLLKGFQIVSIDRDDEDGIMNGAKALANVLGISNPSVTGERANIPRTHLTYYARVWEGTSGDSVINSSDQYQGLAFAVVAPRWSWEQDVELDRFTLSAIKKMTEKLRKEGLRLP